jgi:hypothetical protein
MNSPLDVEKQGWDEPGVDGKYFRVQLILFKLITEHIRRLGISRESDWRGTWNGQVISGFDKS